MSQDVKEQIAATLKAYKAWRATPIVDDDFPEMMERFDLEMGRLERLIR